MTTNAQQTYLNYLNKNKKRPISLAHFLKNEGLDSTEFYKQYSSTIELEQAIFAQLLAQTIEQLHADGDVYFKYSVREKLLALLFTLINNFNANKNFVQTVYKKTLFAKLAEKESVLNEFKKDYLTYTNLLIEEGKQTQEIAKRLVLSSYYKHVLWTDFLFILNFWLRDKSQDNEKTDLAIEKSINFTADLLGKTPVDSGFELLKFMVFKR